MKDLEAVPEVAEALRVVLSTSRPARFRVLTVVCMNDHIAARVYRTAVGLVVLHETGGESKQRSAVLAGIGEVQLPPSRGARVVRYAYSIDKAAGEWPDLWPMQCRCSTLNPEVWDLHDAIAAGRKRLRVSA